MADKPNFRENAVRVIAVLGLIAVLLLGAWGIIQIAFAIPSFFGNLGGSASNLFTREPAVKESLTVALPSPVVSSQPFTVQWNHVGGTGAYAYTLSYACGTGLTLRAPVPAGTYETINCNTPFNFVQASSSMPLVAILSGTSAATTSIAVTATQLSSGSVKASGAASTTVQPARTAAGSTSSAAGAAKPATSKPKPAITYVPSGQRSNLYGLPDLAIRIVNVNTNAYGHSDIVFEVANIGTNVSPARWSFTANLPIAGGYLYASPAQQALYPGDRIVYTMGFDAGNYGYDYRNCVGYSQGCLGSGTNYGYDPVTITVDPYGYIAETNKNNNTIQTSVQASDYYAPSYGGGYY